VRFANLVARLPVPVSAKEGVTNLYDLRWSRVFGPFPAFFLLPFTTRDVAASQPGSRCILSTLGRRPAGSGLIGNHVQSRLLGGLSKFVTRDQ
jgi:hypothetical protein